MKNKIIVKLLFVFLAVTHFVSCDAVDFSAPDKTFQGSDYVYFASRTVSVSEGDDENGVTINVHRSNADAALTINLEIESKFEETGMDASDQFTINPSNLELTFQQGQHTSQIQVIPINNQIADGNKLITITMVASTDPSINLGFEGPDNLNRTVEVTIVDNDCPIDFDAWNATFTVNEVFTGGPNEGLSLAAAFGERYQVEFVQSENDPTGFTYQIFNSEGFNQYFIDGTEVFFNSCGGTLEFEQPLNVAEFADMAIESATFDEGNFSITATGPLGNFGPYEFVFEKIEE